MSVPLDAERFKQAVYDVFGITASLPSLLETQDGTTFSEPPPFTIGYVRREGKLGSDGYYRGGAMRKLVTKDENWFMEMLHNETQAYGSKLIIIPAKKRESLKRQVKDIVRAGFVIGIHGANLVNAMFMLFFGVLMEIMPNNATEECYIGSAISSLKYLRMECINQLGLLDSGCHPGGTKPYLHNNSEWGVLRKRDGIIEAENNKIVLIVL